MPNLSLFIKFICRMNCKCQYIATTYINKVLLFCQSQVFALGNRIRKFTIYIFDAELVWRMQLMVKG